MSILETNSKLKRKEILSGLPYRRWLVVISFYNMMWTIWFPNQNAASWNMFLLEVLLSHFDKYTTDIIKYVIKNWCCILPNLPKLLILLGHLVYMLNFRRKIVASHLRKDSSHEYCKSNIREDLVPKFTEVYSKCRCQCKHKIGIFN